MCYSSTTERVVFRCRESQRDLLLKGCNAHWSKLSIDFPNGKLNDKIFRGNEMQYNHTMECRSEIAPSVSCLLILLHSWNIELALVSLNQNLS